MRSIEDIQKIAKTRPGGFDGLRKQQEIDYSFYELTFKAGVPSNYTQLTPDTARQWIDSGVRSFTLDNPLAHIAPRKDTEHYRKTDAQIESWVNGWLDHMSGEQPNPIKTNAKHILFGECFFKMLVDSTKYTEEIEKLNHFPLIVQARHPMTIYPSRKHDGLRPRNVLEIYDRTVEEVEEACEEHKWKFERPGGMKDDDLLKWVEWWSHAERSYLVGRDIENLFPVLTPAVLPNTYGLTPYVHGYSGYGLESKDGALETLARSILYQMRDTIKADTRAFSQMDAIIARYAWIFRYLKGNEEDLKKFVGEKKTVDFDPGKVKVVPESVTFQQLEGPSPPVGLYEWQKLLSAKAEAPKILSGEAPGGVTAGYPMNILSSAGKSLYKEPFKNLEDALGEVVAMGLQLIETEIKEPVGVRTMHTKDNNMVYGEETLNPEDIKGYYVCKVELMTDSPESNEMKERQGDLSQGAHVISHRTNLIRYHGMTQKEAEEESSQLLAEEAINTNPMLKEALGVMALKRLGMEDALKEGEEEAKITTQNAPGMANLPIMKGRNAVDQGYPIENKAEQTARIGLGQ